MLACGRDRGCSRAREGSPSIGSVCLSLCLSGWEMVVFLRGGAGSAGERRRAELVKGTSREVPQLLCRVK